MSAILVTGASGLVGRGLVPALRAAGHAVVTTSGSAAGVDLPARDLASPWVAAELVSSVGPELVMHLAGGTAADAGELYRRNVTTTASLLAAVGAMERPAYCVVLGSAAEYGDGGGTPLGEDGPLAPVSDYGRAKVAQTTLALEMARELRIPLTVVRPFNLVTPALSPGSALGNLRRQLLAAAGSERTVHCGRLDIVRDYVPLAVLIEALVLLADNPLPGMTLNVCSGVGLELGGILAAMAAELGVALQVVSDPVLAGLPAAPVVIGDPSRMRALLGLSPQPTCASVARTVLGG